MMKSHHTDANRTSRRVLPPPFARRGVRAVFIYLVVLMLGVAMTTSRTPGAGQSGLITMLVGAGGCAWELGQWARAVRRQQATRIQKRERAELKTERAARKTQQYAQRRQRRQTQQHAVRRHAALQQTVRQAQSEQNAQNEAQRQARFETISREAARLQSLPDAQFLQTLPALFATRGLRLQTDALASRDTEPMSADGFAGDMRFLQLTDETLVVARVLPQGHTAIVADIESLEQWRQAAGASQAYLVGRSGFSTPALRLAPRFPLTLAEPHLLAQWQQTAMQNEPPAALETQSHGGE